MVEVKDGVAGAVSNGAVSDGFDARRRARAYAVQALYQWSFQLHPMPEVIRQFCASHSVEADSMAYFKALSEDVTVERKQIDQLLAKAVLDRSLESLSPVVLAVLRLGVCELAVYSELPPAVIIGEANRLAQRFGPPEAVPFVTGALDCVARNLHSSTDKPSTDTPE